MKTVHKKGIYKDFSGEIKWRSTFCKVRNADFEILEKEDDRGNEIVFADSVFVSGEVRWCVIKNGLNLDCNFKFCDIDYMINKGGKIYECNWRDGVFEGGFFRCSTWYDGVWISGEWDKGENSKKERMALPPDKWKE